MNWNWVWVIIGGLIEILWATGLKYANHWAAWIGIALLICASFALLIRATYTLPVATVYAVFTGIGAAGTVVVEMVLFGEPFSWTKIGFLLLLLTGIIGLKLVTTVPDEQEGES